MPALPVDDLKPGMILQAPVCNLDRQLLLGAGAVIGERHIRLFQSWGILEVSVRDAESAPTASAGPVDPGAAERADREVCQVLGHQTIDSPLMLEVRRVLVARKLHERHFREAA